MQARPRIARAIVRAPSPRFREGRLASTGRVAPCLPSAPVHSTPLVRARADASHTRDAVPPPPSLAVSLAGRLHGHAAGHAAELQYWRPRAVGHVRRRARRRRCRRAAGEKPRSSCRAAVALKFRR
eukprot:6183139-Pleurochrysis_carterae.AAC.7